MKPLITLKNVGKKYHDDGPVQKVLWDINLTIYPGEFLVMVGPSGSGKSTLLRIMAGIDPAHSGNVTYATTPAPGTIGFVFQHFAILPWLTVYQNIEVGVRSANLTESARHQRVTRELRRFGLEKFAHVHPKDLSGGMRQRVGFARALANDQQIIFLDEPFSELDSFTAAALRQELLTIWHERRPTIVMVTHLIPEAIQLADRIAIITPRPGTIEKVVVNRLNRPRNLRSATAYALEDELYRLAKP